MLPMNHLGMKLNSHNGISEVSVCFKKKQQTQNNEFMHIDMHERT